MVLYRKVFSRNLLKLTLGGFSPQVSHEPLHCSALLLREKNRVLLGFYVSCLNSLSPFFIAVKKLSQLCKGLQNITKTR